MSKVSEAKQKQGYTEKSPCCSVCKHYRSKIAIIDEGYGPWTHEHDKRCALGGFAVKSRAYCNHFERIG